MTTVIEHNVIDQARLESLLGRVVQDLSAGESGVATYIGDSLGLYRAMQGGGPLTPEALAAQTGTYARLVREWLHNQAAGGYVDYDGATGRFELTPEQAAVFADEDSPTFLVGVIDVTAAMWAAADRLVDSFRTGNGIDYGEHDERLARGVSRLFAPLYKAALVPQWIPAIDGLEAKLAGGARVLDVGCGTGISTVLMAEAFPKSEFLGYDLDARAIESARNEAARRGLADRMRFEVADATTYFGNDYGVACFFDALHDMGNPRDVVRAVASQLAPGGIVLAVEPAAGDRVEDSFTPLGRLYLAGSTAICTPTALAHGEEALGAQAGPAKLIDVLESGGLRDVKVADTTVFNLILEARK